MMYAYLMERYLKYLCRHYSSDHIVRNSRKCMTELLRCSLCYGMGIPFTNALIATREIGGCAHAIFSGVNQSNWTDEYRQGVLQACLRCLDICFEREGVYA